MSPVKYDIFGRKVGSHHLALGILTTVVGGIIYAASGPKKVANAQPAINASSKEEENFVQAFLEENDKGAAKH
ncbi:hypothetical protein AAFC00_002468 [Neodothiora populina]|uniref:ATP synthase subunit K, mitochondrial n=1 Tax=Neodothiora populina TaxID=2781224 RepID=A0ABR3P7Y0_9PEZI